MKTLDLPSWSDFPKAIADIRAKFATRTVELGDGREEVLRNDILFRGQSNSEWELKTTLERTTCTKYSVQSYLQRAESVVNEIESLTGSNWQLSPYPKIAAVQDSMHPHLPCYAYLVYLRHHGFPSPLPDWTKSPYIAAYFAMEQSNEAVRCSVYVFIETPEGGKSLRGGDVMITSMGPYITTHIRHFAQKASYTIATRWDNAAKMHHFCPHENVSPCPVGVQDVLIKITIPRSDRVCALRELEDYNINHYTLFQTEDSLVRSLGLRAFDLDGT